MWKQSLLIGAGALAALALTAGCSSDSQKEQSAAPSSSAVSTAPAAQDHNQADVMFNHHMIPHHQQAIEMSDIILAKQGIDPRVVDLATKIKAAQGPEITQMQEWLRQWGNPPMPPMTSMTPGEGHGGHDMGNMPGMPGGMMGMMSPQEITALKNAQGVEAAKLFLTGMITHHEGAIAMAQTEIKDGKYAPEIKLSQSIITTQQQEIDTMKGILATL